jgi:hypothetical protein
MNKKLLVATAFVMASLSALAFVAEPVKIAWAPKAGTEFKYKFRSTASNIQGPTGPTDLKISADLLHKIKEVKADGSVVVEDRQTGFTIFLGDTDVKSLGAPIPDSIVETSIEKANGEVIERKSDAPAEFQNSRMDNVASFIYPDHAVNVGDTWNRKLTADKAKGTFSSETTYTYSGSDTIGSIKCNKIDVAFKETDAPTNVTATGTYWISAEDGELVKASIKMKNADFGHGMPPADTETTIERV